jgi:hypothetical protein
MMAFLVFGKDEWLQKLRLSMKRVQSTARIIVGGKPRKAL